ncbi:MAG: ISH6 family transposase [Thermoplasmatota archaeon]
MTESCLKYNVTWTSPITLPTLTHRMHEAGMAREDLIRLLEARDDELVHQHCGPPYHRLSPQTIRAGTRKRTLGTRFGRVTIRYHRIQKDGRTFAPLWADVLIQPRRIYQDDIEAITVQIAERMTYRNTREETGRLVEGVSSPRTINRRVIENGTKLQEIIHERDLSATTHQGDGTKLHQRGRTNKHYGVNIVLATGRDRTRVRLLTVGEKWTARPTVLEKTKFVDDKGSAIPATTMTDLETGLPNALTPVDGFWQPCLIHAIRYFGIALWQDGMKESPEKRALIGTLRTILEHLKNSLALHLPKGETDAIEHRIHQTTKEIRRLATRVQDDGWSKAALFLRRVSLTVVTFAELALKGITIPWHNNLLERLMGEVSKRCKHRWMSWTTKGASALLTLVILRAVEPDTHAHYWRQKLFPNAPMVKDRGVSITQEIPEF